MPGRSKDGEVKTGSMAYLEQREICFQHRNGEIATLFVFIKRKEVGNGEERIIKRDGKWC